MQASVNCNPRRILGADANCMQLLTRIGLPVPVQQGLILLSGNTVAQLIPAVAAPLLTRLYKPADFGVFAVVLAAFGLIAPVACLRYDIAIMLPEKDIESAQISALCFTVSALISVALLIVIAISWSFISIMRVQAVAPLLLVMLPTGVLLISVQLVAQNWCLRTRNYKIQSRAMVAQMAVTILVQLFLGATIGSKPYLLVLGTLAGYSAQLLVYFPLLRHQVLPHLRRSYSIESTLKIARKYARFPLYTGPYALIGQLSVRGMLLILSAVSSKATVGQFAVAQRVVVFPVVTIMSAASQLFFSRVARKLDDPRVEAMVHTGLGVGPLILSPFFLMITFFAEPLFGTIFGREWAHAGQFAAILAVASMIKTLTAWLDRIYDIKSRQSLSLILETAYLVLGLGTAYLAAHSLRSPDAGVIAYAAATVVFYVVWMLTALAVADFPLRIGVHFLAVLTGVSITLIACDRIAAHFGASTIARAACDSTLALPIVAYGIRVGAMRFRSIGDVGTPVSVA